MPQETGLDEGEKTVLQLAVSRRLSEVIVDDKAAIRAAKLLSLKPISTPFLLLRSCRSGDLSAAEFRGLLERLVGLQYFISAPMYQR
ncbi:MAG: hypothetical protein ACYDDF_11255 [Thermoplasmatota archaeon]